MKKLLALILVLAMAAAFMLSCGLLPGFGGNDNDGANNNNNGETPDEDDSYVIEEDDGDVDVKDNIDPDAWTKVEK